LADQITKTLVVDHLARGPVHLIGPFSFALAYNSGVAFSIGSGLTLPIILVAVVVVMMVFWMSRGVPSVPMSVALGLILGGASGNLSDRLFRNHGGAVVDFIASRFWPTFNVADASIVIGAVVVGIVYWRDGLSRTASTTTEKSST
jgi:signal peptidase II